MDRGVRERPANRPAGMVRFRVESIPEGESGSDKVRFKDRVGPAYGESLPVSEGFPSAEMMNSGRMFFATSENGTLAAGRVGNAGAGGLNFRNRPASSGGK